MKKIAFTICSNNYLAQASLLVESFLKENPDFEFYIGLVDLVQPGIKYPVANNLHILPCAGVVPAAQLQKMAEVYKIVELNTSVKPFYISYFFSQHSDCKVIYLDPDIYVYHPFNEIVDQMERYDFVITPHILSPIPLDEKYPQERLFVKFGIYNLGFIAIRKTQDSIAFINWWKERLAVLCYSEPEIGLFVDQSWVGFLPAFSSKVFISHHPGMNAAFWNLHERFFHSDNEMLFVNKTYPLMFFHFSSFDLNNISALTKGGTRYSFDDRPDLKEIFESYGKEFLEAKQRYNAGIECVYTKRNLRQQLAYYWNRYKLRKLSK
jgi:hypothetical protein